MRIRSLILAGAAVVLAAPLALAAPKPQIVDPKGDYPVANGDIISVTFSTVPKGLKEVLQIDMVVAAPIDPNVAYAYRVDFTADECDYALAYYNNPAGSEAGQGCQDPDAMSLPTSSAKISGAKITWTIKLPSGAVKRGVELDQLIATTSPSGFVSGGISSLAGDTGRGTDTWVVGSDRPQKKKKG